MKSRIAVLLSFNDATAIDYGGGRVSSASLERGMTLPRVATSLSNVEIGSDLMHVREPELCVHPSRLHSLIAPVTTPENGFKTKLCGNESYTHLMSDLLTLLTINMPELVLVFGILIIAVPDMCYHRMVR
jgi:hypothetical protein